jgi:membrane-associated phospholipid phosphatase
VIETGAAPVRREASRGVRSASQARSRGGEGRTLRLLVVALAALVLFAALALAVRRGAVDRVDDAITWRVQTAAAGRLYRIGRALGVVGGGEVEVPLALAAALGLALAGRPRAALALLAALAAITAVEIVSKQFLLIDRAEAAGLLRAPPHAMPSRLLGLLPLVPEVGYPSGHLSRATLLLGMAAAWAWRVRAPIPRALALLPLLGLLALMALTRVALPYEHTPSDVVGGYLLGLAALAAALALGGLESASAGPRAADGQRAVRSGPAQAHSSRR